jgi:hypothetical protein
MAPPAQPAAFNGMRKRKSMSSDDVPADMLPDAKHARATTEATASAAVTPPCGALPLTSPQTGQGNVVPTNKS